MKKGKEITSKTSIPLATTSDIIRIACKEMCWQLTHITTERHFDIQQLDDSSYFLSEEIPNGYRCQYDTNGEADFWFDDTLNRLSYTTTPNNLFLSATKEGIKRHECVCTSCVITPYSRTFGSLNDCINAINEALRNDHWFDSNDKSKEVAGSINTGQEVSKKQEHNNYVKRYQRVVSYAEKHTHGLFKGCHNMFGPLPKDAQQKILSYINNPTKQLWDEIHCMIISSGSISTIWQAWLDVDEYAPRSKPVCDEWHYIPDPETLKKAIRHAVQNAKDEFSSKEEI